MEFKQTSLKIHVFRHLRGLKSNDIGGSGCLPRFCMLSFMDYTTLVVKVPTSVTLKTTKCKIAIFSLALNISSQPSINTAYLDSSIQKY